MANSVNVEFLPGLIYLQGRAAWEQGDLVETQAALDELAQPQSSPWLPPKMRFGV